MTIADIQEIEGLIDEWANSLVRTAELPNIILDKARSANLEPNQLKQLVEKSLSARGLSDRQIRRVMPKELKRNYLTVTNTEYSDIVSESAQTVTGTDYIPPRVEQPTPTEQEYIDSVQTQTVPVPQPPQVVVEQPKMCMSSGVIQCPLIVTSKGIDYKAMITVRIAEGHKVKLDPIQRSDIVKA